MSFCLNFPLFLIVLSLAGSVISSVAGDKGARRISLLVTLLSTVLNAVILCYTLRTRTSFTYLMGHFPHPWGNELKIGILESLFSTAFSFILFFCLLGGREPVEMRITEGKRKFFYLFGILVQASLLVLCYTNDLFTGYVFIEICTLASCGLLMVRENGKTILASIRYMIFSLIGSGLFLFGVIFLYDITGHLLIPNMKESIASLWATGAYRMPLLSAVCLISMGLAIKSGLFPFHLWMADTYGSAVPASSAILSGLVSKGYIFFLIKVIYDVFGTEVFYGSGIHNVLYVLGALGIIVGSIGALREDNIFRMIAYSSAAQIGYIYLGLGLAVTAGVEAALFHILTHAVTKPALFLASRFLSRAEGDAGKFHTLQGSAYRDPVAGALFCVEAFSMIGLPLTMGFISKYLFGMGAFASSPVKTVPTLMVLAISTILNTLYFARSMVRLYSREHREQASMVHGEWVKGDGTLLYRVTGIVFAVVNICFGVFAGRFMDLLQYGISLF